MPAALFLSSGNLIADRRYDFGRDLQMRGDLAAAVDLMRQALELMPDFASAWFALGDLQDRLGDAKEAVIAFRRAQQADPEDRHGAKLRLMRLGAEKLSPMPQAYVRAMFDQYAPRFDKTLLDDLDYCGPQVLLKAVLSACRDMQRPARFGRALDLGCGTGLAAVEFASVVDEWIGIDVSPGMVEKARATGVYTRLDVADMLEGVGEEKNASADLIISADAVVYVPDLGPLMTQAARVLTAKSLVAFTAETHDGDGIVLGAGLRYAHAADYLRDAIEAAGLKLHSLEKVSTRIEADQPVPGLVAVAFK